MATPMGIAIILFMLYMYGQLEQVGTLIMKLFHHDKLYAVIL